MYNLFVIDGLKQEKYLLIFISFEKILIIKVYN